MQAILDDFVTNGEMMRDADALFIAIFGLAEMAEIMILADVANCLIQQLSYFPLLSIIVFMILENATLLKYIIGYGLVLLKASATFCKAPQN